MTDTNKPMTLSDVLRGGRQCDEDGVEIIMSRQACCEAADTIDRLTADCEKLANQSFAARAEAKALVDHANAERDKCGSGAGCLHKDALIDSLTAERDAYKLDAARYRWLRAGDYSIALSRSILNDTPHGVDATIDAAIAKEAK